MKIALLGYGKMGKEIEKIALQQGDEIVLKIDADNLEERTLENLKKAEVAIEFSTPATAKDNIIACFNAKLPIVVGTTGWYDHYDELSALCQQQSGALFYATNYSIGVNIFWHMNKMLAKVMNEWDAYGVKIEEIHHTQKVDAPSGTAITTAEGILEMLEGKQEWENFVVNENDPDPETDKRNILITSIRKDNIPGTHTVTYQSEVDAIELKHTAFNRVGFAKGALVAAAWLKDKKGVFTMQDMLNFS